MCQAGRVGVVGLLLAACADADHAGDPSLPPDEASESPGGFTQNVAAQSDPKPAPDRDCDNVTDAADACPATRSGETVDASGCSLNDLVPCARPDTPWPSKAAYVSARRAQTQRFYREGWISLSERNALLLEALLNRCGAGARPAPDFATTAEVH